jgi:hypothetical protein
MKEKRLVTTITEVWNRDEEYHEGTLVVLGYVS